MKEYVKHYTDSINYELEQTARLMRMLSNQLFKKLNLSLSCDEHAALDTISINDGICQRDLAKLILKDRANTGRILNILEEKGFIKRLIDIKNNRLVKKLSITETGYRELNSINNKMITYFESLTRKVSENEIQRVHETLRAFRLNLENIVQINI